MASRSDSGRGGTARRALRARMAALALLLWMLAPLAPAAVFRDARYGEPATGEPGARLVDVYTPDTPGPHPVLLLLHGAVDKSAATRWPVRLAARGYVVFNANHRAAPADARIDVVDALRYVARGAAGYGGDPRRVHLLGADADAALVARAATDPRLAGAIDGGPAGLIVVGDPGPWPGGRAEAPALLVDARSDPGARAAIEAWAEHLRRQGLSAQVVALAADAVLAAEPVIDAIDAWIAAGEIPRVQRLENLVFAAPPAAGPGAASAFATLATDLYAAQGNAVWRRASAGGDWRRELEFTAPIACLAAWSGRLHAVLAAADEVAIAQRDDRGGWTQPQRLPRGADGAAGTPQCRIDPAGGAWIKAGRQVWHVDGDLEASALLRLPGNITSIAPVDGSLLMAVEATGSVGPALWRLGPEGTATRVLTLSARQSPWRRLVAVPDPEGGGREVALGEQDGRLFRYDPMSGHAPVEELDLDAALRSQWGGLPDGGPPRLASDFVPVAHPETGDLVHLAGIEVRHPRAREAIWRGAWYLVRDLDGRYALGQVSAPESNWPPAAGLGPIRDLAVSPAVGDAGRVVWFGGSDPGWIAAGSLDRAGPWQGLWWDPQRPGHGLLLQRDGGQWLALLHTYDADGAPIWYRTRLRAEGAGLESDAAGLVAQRGGAGSAAAEAVEAAGRLALRRDPDAIDAACAGAAPASPPTARAAFELELRGRKASWCLQPFRFAPPGLPRVAARGLYGADPGDPRWGVYVETQGTGDHARSLAILYYFDDDGLPRWALGSGLSRHGASELELRRFHASCIGCAARAGADQAAGTLLLRFAGYCGELRGAASLQLALPGATKLLAMRDIALGPASDSACY